MPIPSPVVTPDPSWSEVEAPLGRLAGARSGDKGGDANIGVWVRDPDHLDWLLATLGSPDAVRSLLPEAAGLDIEVHPLPNLLAVNVLVRGLLGDGVASATRPDPQAKGLGEYLRSRWVRMPAAWRDAAGCVTGIGHGSRGSGSTTGPARRRGSARGHRNPCASPHRR
jgi:hypothetical protein